MFKLLRLWLVIVYTLMIPMVVNAANYVVDVPVLNFRSCAGTNCQIIGKLSKGEIVDYIEDYGEWAKIKANEKTGFVIKKALTEDYSDTFEIIPFVLYTMLFLAGIALAIFIYMLPARLAANNKNANKIFVLNIFLGWIPVIWLILFACALIGEEKEK